MSTVEQNLRVHLYTNNYSQPYEIKEASVKKPIVVIILNEESQSNKIN